MILGYGVGACAGGVPLYIAELSPAAIRGRIVAIEQMILCLGELLAFWINYSFNFLETDDWWRIPLATDPPCSGPWDRVLVLGPS